MSPANRIPIPWKHRWRRFRYSAMPAVCFFACMGVVILLWQQQGRMSTATGLVESQRKIVTASAAGRLLPVNLPQKLVLTKLTDGVLDLVDPSVWEDPAAWDKEFTEDWKISDEVRRGQIIARLDHRVAEAGLQKVNRTIARLRKDMVKMEAELLLDHADRVASQMRLEADEARHLLQLVTDAERYAIDILEREAAIAEDTMTLKRLDHTLRLIEDAHSKKHISDVQYFRVKDQYDEIDARIAGNKKTLEKTRRLLERAERDRRDFQAKHIELPIADTQALLAPLEAEIEVQRAELDRLKLQIDSLVIYPTIDGEICEVFCRPGDEVQAGEAILTIASTTSRRIVCHIPESQNVRPAKDQDVFLKQRYPGSRPVLAKVTEVGPQVELIPEHQRADPRRPEWGLRVIIGLPKPGATPDSRFEVFPCDLFPAIPGEKVDVRFKRS